MQKSGGMTEGVLHGKRQTRRGKGRLMPKEAALQRTARSGIQTLCKFTAFCKKNNIPPPCFAIFSVNISAFCLYLACFSLFPRAFGPLFTLTQGGRLPALWPPHLYGGFGRLQSVCLGFEVYAALESPCRAHDGEEQSVEVMWQVGAPLSVATTSPPPVTLHLTKQTHPTSIILTHSVFILYNFIF